MNNQELSFANPEQDAENTITVKLSTHAINLLQYCVNQLGISNNELLEEFINERLVDYLVDCG